MFGFKKKVIVEPQVPKKTPPNEEVLIKPQKKTLVFLPGNQFNKLDLNELTQQLKSMDYSVIINNVGTEDNKEVISLTMDNVNVYLAGPVKLPTGHQEYAYATTIAWWWPEAKQELSSVDSYYVIIVSPDTGDTIAQHMLVSYLVLGILKTMTGIKAVYWSESDLLQSKEEFTKKIVAYKQTNELPFQLWINYQIGKFPDGTLGAATIGLSGFNLPELEISSKGKYNSSELFTITNYLAEYNIAKMSLKDGETIAGTKDDIGHIKIEKPQLKRKENSSVIRIRFD